MRKAHIYVSDIRAGLLEETDSGFAFTYDASYVQIKDSKPVSLTLPIRSQTYTSSVMFPFFDGLIPEGWLLDVAERNWKINPRDRMGLLILCCKDCIGNVSVIEID